MGEYITKNNALSAICFGCNIEFSDEPCEPCSCKIRESIMALPAADVAPKSEVDELKGELAIAERHEKDARALFKDAVIQLQNARAEIAKEIFAEIDKCIHEKRWNSTKFFLSELLNTIAELKKKYIGE